MKRLLLIAVAVTCLAACSAGLDKKTVVENGEKARSFVAQYGQPSPALIQGQQWPVVETPDLAGVTWHALPTDATSASSRYSLLEQAGTSQLYLAREGGTSHQMKVSEDLQVFGPIVIDDGT